MVFEGILVEVLNTFLGDYIENLDKDQLSVAVWSGNIELRELKFKDSLLDDLNYPIRTAFGYLGKLGIDIPWKNLYTKPIVITVEDVLLLVVPNTDAEYDVEKGKQKQWEQKQRQLKHLELVGSTENPEEEGAKAKEPVKTTFKDKLIAKLISNIQVDIKNVHIRYEGTTEEDKSTFCFGATLGSLLFKSTDDKFNIKTMDDACHLIYKLLRLEHLSAYCSPKEGSLFAGLDKSQMLAAFMKSFESEKESPAPIRAYHILEPLFFTSRLALNPKPEASDCDYMQPKMTIDMGLDAINLCLSRSQYAGILEFLESMEGLNMKSKYRDFLIPEKPIGKKNAQKWWAYAQQAILEVDVRPRLRQWSWEYIKDHRDRLRRYSALYSQKIRNPILSPAEDKDIEDLEKQLDVFNIVLARNQAQFDVTAGRTKGSWWSWLTGHADGDGGISDEKDIRHRLKQALNDEERQKLNAALEYTEGGDAPVILPPTYVALRLLWDLDKASVRLTDDSDNPESPAPVAALRLAHLSGKFEQRPTADGLFLKTEVKDILITGKERNGMCAVIAKPDQGSPAWMQLLYESNPGDCDAGVRLHLFVDPVQLKYDAETVNAIVKFFKPPESIALRQLQAQALLALQALRESTVAKVRDILQNHRYTDFNVDFKAPYFVLLEHGVEEKNSSALVVDFGRIQLGSIAKGGALNPDIASLEDLKEQSYEKYQVEFKDLQIIFAEKGDDWQAARHEKDARIRILQPVNCSLQLWNCLIRNHPLLPLGRVFGELPLITVDISENRLLKLLRLLLTIPLPEVNYTGDMEFSEKARDIAREYRDMKSVQTLFAMKQPEQGGHDIVVLDFHLTIHEISISILNKEAGCKPLMKIAAVQLSQNISLTSSEMVAVTELNDMFVEFMLKDSKAPVKLIRAHHGDNAETRDDRVVQLTYTSVSSISPDFESKHNCTLSRLDAEFSGLEVVVDQMALLDIAAFVEALRTDVVAMVEETKTSGPRLLSSYFSAPAGEAEGKTEVDAATVNVAEVSTDVTLTTADEGFVSDDKLIHFALHAVGQVVTVTLVDARGEICRSVMEGLDVGFLQKKSSMIVEAGLKAISLENPDSKAIYPMILRTKGEELLSFKATIHSEPIEIQRERGLFSQEIEIALGGVEFIFLNVFFMDISRFAEQLQGIFVKFSGVTEAASAKTTQAAMDIYEQALRLRLEVDLKAPVVILPQHSQSRNALVFDLGSLRIANELQSDQEAMIDHVTLSISSIAFDRVENYNAEKGSGATFSLFKQPDPTIVLLKRNLSFKSDQSRPEIEAEGKLPSLEFAMSNLDYQTILDTFTQNFAEGVEADAAKSPPNSPSKVLSPVKEEPEPVESSYSAWELGKLREPIPQLDRPGSPINKRDSVEYSTDGTFSPPLTASTPSPTTTPDKLHLAKSKCDQEASAKPLVPRFKFTFDLDSVVASLYWINRPKSRNRPPATSLEATEKLAQFELNGLHVDAAITSEYIVDGGLSLADVSLQDCRGAFEKRINKLLYLRESGEKNVTAEALVHLKAQVDSDGNQSINVKMAPFEVAVIVDFFIEVSEFFTVRAPPAPAPSTSSLPSSSRKNAPFKQQAKATVESASAKRAATTSATPIIPKSRTLAINVDVNSPTILLVEDPKNLDSKVLLLSTNLKLCMGIMTDGQSFQASAENVRMFATRYKTRSANPQRILDPTDLALQFKHAVDAGQHIGVTCTDIVITITPSVIKLITVTLAGLGNINLTDELPEIPVGVYDDLWQPEPLRDDHWFLQPPNEAQSDDKILSVLDKAESTPPKQLYEGDMFMFDIPSVMVVIEVGEVNRFVPAFLLEARAFGTVRDWTTRLQAKAMLYLEMGYYNTQHDIWEPVIEPIDDGRSERPWEVSVEIIRNDITINELRYAAKQGMHLQRRCSDLSTDTLNSSFNSTASSDMIPDAAGTDVMQESAALQVNVKATEPLQITITKTGVELMQSVVELFMEAVNKDMELQESDSSAPYVVQNHLGLDVKIQVITPLQLGELDLTAETDSDGIIQVKSGASREIFVNSKVRKIRKNALHQTSVEQDLRMRLIVAGRTIEMSLLKAERHFYFIQNPEDVQRPYRLIVDIVAETSYKIIHLQSSMTITSYLLMPMELQGGFASVDHIGVVDPNQTIFMPIRSVQFNEKAVLAARPAKSELYQQSEKIPIGDILRMDTEEKTFLLNCEPTKLGVDPSLYYILFCRVVHVKYENTSKFMPNSVEYAVFLRSVITIANVLPYDMTVGYLDAKETRLIREEAMRLDPNIVDNHVPIEAGGSRPLYTVHPDKHRLVLRLKDYMNHDWEGDFVISALKDEFTPCVLSCLGLINIDNSNAEHTVAIGIRMLKEDGTIFLTLYSPFWMLNKTGLPLSYREPVREHFSDFVQPLLFSTSYSNLQEKRKICIKTGTSEWSKKFSPDAVGSNGVVMCKGSEGERSYDIGMQIKSSATVVTKIVVFTPYYVLSNVSDKVAIEVKEMHECAQWILLEPKTTIPFWPIYSEERKDKVKEKDKDDIPDANRLVCRIAGTAQVSQPFCYSVLQTNLLQVRNKFGGIYVETQVSECNAITTFQPFSPGRVTNKLINMTHFPVHFKQHADVQFQELASDSEGLFAWPIPFEEKVIEFFFRDNNVFQTELNQDDSGTIPIDGEIVFWVTFYHEHQRILLFTEDVELALRVQQSVDLEPTSLELVASIESIGLSLVNNISKHEVLYAGIVSGGPTWQWRKLKGNSKRYHTFKGKEARQLEDAFQKYKSNVEADIHVDGLTALEHSNIEVDFSQMLMSKPHHRQLQRIYEDGLWCRVKTSSSQYQVHVKLQKLQIDNPNPLSQYPTIFIPVPLPESVGQKPIVEASLIIRQTALSKVPQFKLLEALIQEVEIRADQGVINAIVAIIQPEEENGFKARQKMLDNFLELDGAELRRNLQDTVAGNAGTDQPLLFDYFVIHPLKLHISFSLTGAENDQQSALSMSSEWMNLFMKTLGVAASEINDVVIKLATFERMHKTFNQRQIQQQLQSHYVSQLLKQLYTIAFGLDILGNPFGLIRGITGGVRDLFYEPYEGAVEGPEEFMSGLGSGVQSLVGKSVGGVLGTAEKLTGSVGRALATVSFDEKFIRNRQREKNRTPTDLPGALAQSGKALGQGVVQGITGVVKRPLEGARQEGAVGFIKGVGKGLIGVVVRPTTGIVDSLTGSIEAIRRMATSEVDPVRLRPTRHIGPDGIVRPYNLHQAEGQYIFREIRNKELKEDEYVTHLVTTRERRHVLLLTTNRVLYLERGEIFQGRYSAVWQYEWANFMAAPSMSEKGVMFPVFEAEGKGLKGLFHLERKDKPRFVLVEDVDAGEWFVRKVQAVMESMRE
ncbi:Vacuolar protein sorting-associated protein 13C [Hypsibius exemplaris]|uniref:Vacuolar protein sorting-associated protein 13C n=1 Tax=Hypsibius exemplaris TaxID=2072580 RepID=A0A1W0XFA2_HYPEX|nr:Vacuolar protein sorting-associated protein 13C [Hypsibius exemplaris]